MNTRRTIFNLFTSLVEPNTKRRPDRVERRPLGEQLEARTMLSAVTLGVATLVAPRSTAAALVIPVNQGPSFGLENDIKDQINVENDAVLGS